MPQRFYKIQYLTQRMEEAGHSPSTEWVEYFIISGSQDCTVLLYEVANTPYTRSDIVSFQLIETKEVL